MLRINPRWFLWSIWCLYEINNPFNIEVLLHFLVKFWTKLRLTSQIPKRIFIFLEYLFCVCMLFFHPEFYVGYKWVCLISSFPIVYSSSLSLFQGLSSSCLNISGRWHQSVSVDYSENFLEFLEFSRGHKILSAKAENKSSRQYL